jgi:hypothetical protein
MHFLFFKSRSGSPGGPVEFENGSFRVFALRTSSLIPDRISRLVSRHRALQVQRKDRRSNYVGIVYNAPDHSRFIQGLQPHLCVNISCRSPLYSCSSHETPIVSPTPRHLPAAHPILLSVYPPSEVSTITHLIFRNFYFCVSVCLLLEYLDATLLLLSRSTCVTSRPHSFRVVL